jgi:sugar phosphate isomerase/epimerase
MDAAAIAGTHTLPPLTRRSFAAALGISAVAAAAPRAAGATPPTKMKLTLSCGAIGVRATQIEAVEYAIRFGFEAVEADAGWLASAPEAAVQTLTARMLEHGIAWAQAGLSVEFRKGEEEFQRGLRALPATAAALQRAGVSRVTTWLMPTHAALTYRENFRQHAARLRACADVLGAHGCRLGMEYVGPKTLWSSARFPFIHTMREMKELIAEIGLSNVGFVLDSWHWYTAGESAADLKTLTNRDVVSIDLNDAPVGIPLDQQQDGSREMPGSTGVIDIAAFLGALNSIGCDAPARCEPFNAPLRAMAPDQALGATIASLRRVFARAAG